MASICRYLFLEDNKDDIEILKVVLSRLSFPHTASFCRNLSEAKAYLTGAGVYADREKYPFPHFVVSDLNIGLESAFDLLDWRSSQPELSELPILIFSGSISPQDLAEVIRRGAVEIVPKTDDLPALGKRLAELGQRYSSKSNHPG